MLPEIKPRVAVLMASYNGMSFISEQIQSIQNQSNIDLDLIISVDKSSDDTYEYCKNLQYDNLKVLEYGESLGCAKNFYKLIKNVDFKKYDYVSFADQDDIWHSGKLDNAIKALNRFNADGYSSNMSAFWPNGKEHKILKHHKKKKYDFLFESASAGCTFVLNQDLALLIQDWLVSDKYNINEFDAHDWLIYAIARMHNMSWHYDKRSFISYRQHNHNVAGANIGLGAKFSRLKSLFKGGWFNTNTNLLLQIFNDISSHNEKLTYLRFMANPFNLRRVWYHSLFIYFLKCIKII